MTGPGFELQELAARFGLELRGEPSTRIHGVGTLMGAGASELTFLANPAYRKQLPATRAGAVVLRAQDAGDSPVPCLVAKDPYAAFARLAALFEAAPASAPGIHPSAVVEPGAEIAASASIGALCFVSASARISEGALLGPGCVVGEDCELGEGCELVARVT